MASSHHYEFEAKAEAEALIQEEELGMAKEARAPTTDEMSHLTMLRRVFVEAASMLGITVRTPLHPSKGSVSALMRRVLSALNRYIEKFRETIAPVAKACSYVERGLKCFALKRYADAHRCFEKALKLQLCTSLFPLPASSASSAWASCVLCRAHMYSTLHVNNYFRDRSCHLYVVGLECIALYEALVCSEHVLVCLAVSDLLTDC
jgi:hypothetical protein